MKGFITSCFLTLITYVSAKWSVSQNKILYNNNEVNIKGINWHGLENRNNILDGLFFNSMDFYLDLLKSNNFNMIQVPLSEEFILYNIDFYPNNDLISKSQDLQQKKSIEILDILFDKALQRDIGIVLSLTNLEYDNNNPLWYIPNNSNYTLNTFFNTWKILLDRYSNKKNLVGINLYQSPNDPASLGTDDINNDWNLVSNSLINNLITNYNNLDILFFVSGINSGLNINGLNSSNENVVYTINNFAPSVYLNVSINYNDRNSWDLLFGNTAENVSIVISSWGGITVIPGDYLWELNFKSYLFSKNIKNNFFWSLGPTAGVRGGLLSDNWTDIKSVILEILKTLQPEPTSFNFNNKNLRIR